MPHFFKHPLVFSNLIFANQHLDPFHIELLTFENLLKDYFWQVKITNF